METQNSSRQVRFQHDAGSSSIGATNEPVGGSRLETKLSMGYRRAAKPMLMSKQDSSIISTGKRSLMDSVPQH